MNRDALRFGSRVIGLAWACWWVYFAVMSMLAECEPPSGVLVRGSLAVLLFFGSVFVSFRWERAGAWLLVAEGLLVLAVYPPGAAKVFTPGTIAFVVATLGGPPLASGLALLAARRAHGPRRPALGGRS